MQPVSGADIRQKDQATVHPFTSFDVSPRELQVMHRAEGGYVWDLEGRRYLDGIGGLWCVNVGHGRQEIAKAMQQQAQQMAYYSAFVNLTSVPAAQLSQQLCALAPAHLNHLFYSTGGSQANDLAVQLAHFYFHRLGKPEKKIILSRRNAYHGMTYLSGSLTGIAKTHQGFHTADFVKHLAEANCYRPPDLTMSEAEYCDYLLEDARRTIAALGAERIAAFIAEPIMGAGGVLVAPTGYHQRMQQLMHENEILYLSDEVVTAFGRLGHYYASEAVFQLKPDIITIAKGMSSGYVPLGGTLLSDAIYEVISQGKQKKVDFSTGFTYSGHPVACAAALKNLEILAREKLNQQVLALGPYFKARLSELEKLPLVGETRGMHFMLAVEYVANKKTRQPFSLKQTHGKGVSGMVSAAARERGVIVRPVGDAINVISPPLVWGKKEIDSFIGIMQESIGAVEKQLKKA